MIVAHKGGDQHEDTEEMLQKAAQTQTWKSGFTQKQLVVDRCEVVMVTGWYGKQDGCCFTGQQISLFHWPTYTRCWNNSWNLHVSTLS